MLGLDLELLIYYEESGYNVFVPKGYNEQYNGIVDLRKLIKAVVTILQKEIM